MKTHRGHRFTLLELILVLALVAAVLSSAGPSLRGMLYGRRLDEEARRMLAVLRWAPIEAASSGDLLAFWLDPVNDQYGVITADASQETVCHYRLGDNVRLRVEPAVRGADGYTLILAWPDGTMVPENDCTIILEQRARDERLTIAYDPIHNHFAIQEPEL